MRRIAWYDALMWLLFTALGFLFPVLGGIFVPLAFGEEASLHRIAGAGQFAIASAGLLMTTSYFLAKPSSLSRLPLTEWFWLASLTGLVIGTFLFAFAIFNADKSVVNPKFYEIPSLVLFAIALSLAFIAVGLDNTRGLGSIEQRNEDARGRTFRDFEATFQEDDPA